MNPSGKVVIITGASAGIGLATARLFAAHGAQLVLAARDAERLRTATHNLPNAPLIIPTDVADPQATNALVMRTISEYGRIDILINNAGIGLAAPVAEMRREDVLRTLEINLLGPLTLTQSTLPHMQKQGGGQLMFVSSVVGLRALPYLGGYAASKAALDRITESLRVELRGSGIAVTLIRPGTTHTGFSEHRLGQGHEIRSTSSRGITPERVAATMLRAAINEPRVAYASLRDRLTLWFGLLFPEVTDRVLGTTFTWKRRL